MIVQNGQFVHFIRWPQKCGRDRLSGLGSVRRLRRSAKTVHHPQGKESLERWVSKGSQRKLQSKQELKQQQCRYGSARRI